MAFFSKPASLALLSCCLVFGVLLGLTGLSKDSHTTTSPSASPGLRETARHAMAGSSVLASKRDASKLDDENLASFKFPELEHNTGGLWGPDDEERLMLEEEEETKDGEMSGFWGTDTAERKELANALLDGNWDRLMDVDMDMDESFSYSYEM